MCYSVLASCYYRLSAVKSLYKRYDTTSLFSYNNLQCVLSNVDLCKSKNIFFLFLLAGTVIVIDLCDQ